MQDYLEADVELVSGSSEEALALAIGEQTAEIERLLEDQSLTEMNFDWDGGRFWLEVIEASILTVWQTGSTASFPLYDLYDLLHQWGAVGGEHARKLQQFEPRWVFVRARTLEALELRQIEQLRLIVHRSDGTTLG